ncbi:MAG: hypothetical protein AB7S41_07605 [Parvibaculaceae bacterium]
MRGWGLLEALRHSRGLAVLLLAVFLLHPTLRVLAPKPSAVERALLADLGRSLCTPAGASDAHPVDRGAKHDPDHPLCGFACVMVAGCAPVLLPNLIVAGFLVGEDDPPSPVLLAPERSGLRLHPSDIGSRAPPARA